jgi:hypothetical protein
MPTLNHLDPYYKDPIDGIDKGLSDIRHLADLLAIYREIYITHEYTGGVHFGVRPDGSITLEKGAPGIFWLIPFILGVDAMAIEPYCVVRNKDPDTSGDGSEESAYFFVYYLMPLDPDLPKIVVSVLPKKTGNACDDTIARLHEIRAICREAGFWVVAASGDGDHKYGSVMKQVTDKIRGDIGLERQYEDFIEDLVQERDDGPLPFITDFLHFAKCLRRRLAAHPLSMIDADHCFTHQEVSECLGIGDLLDLKSPGAQLKDSIAMGVFNLENLVTLLGCGQLDAAIYFMPIVLWRVANQALNVTRNVRVDLLRTAFEVTRRCDWRLAECRMNTVNRVNEPVYLYRQEDIEKMLSSLVVIGYILRMPLEKINLARLGTSPLEHLFGVTRLGTRGNNGAIRIRRHMARACWVECIAHKHEIQLTPKRKRNLGGTIDDLTQVNFATIRCLPTCCLRKQTMRLPPQIGPSSYICCVNAGIAICQDFLTMMYEPLEDRDIDQRVVSLYHVFKGIYDLVKDGQNNNYRSTRFAGIAIMGRISELAKKNGIAYGSHDVIK